MLAGTVYYDTPLPAGASQQHATALLHLLLAAGPSHSHPPTLTPLHPATPPTQGRPAATAPAPRTLAQ